MIYLLLSTGLQPAVRQRLRAISSSPSPGFSASESEKRRTSVQVPYYARGKYSSFRLLQGSQTVGPATTQRFLLRLKPARRPHCPSSLSLPGRPRAPRHKNGPSCRYSTGKEQDTSSTFRPNGSPNQTVFRVPPY